MTINEIKRALMKALVLTCVYIALSIIAGAILASWGLPFGAGFVLTAISGGALYWLIKHGDAY